MLLIVHHRLARSLAIVDANVEAIWPVAFLELQPGFGDQRPQSGLIEDGKLEQTGDVPPRNNQSVTLADRKSVVDGDPDWGSSQIRAGSGLQNGHVSGFNTQPPCPATVAL